MDRKAGALSLGRAHCMQVLFEQHRFRQTPFEWVYDGLSPVLLADVLASRKGLSIVLATIYVLVGRDVGLTLAMAPVPRAVVPTLAGNSMRTFCACGSFCVPCSSTPYSYAVTCVASAGASTVHTHTNAPSKARLTCLITSICQCRHRCPPRQHCRFGAEASGLDGVFPRCKTSTPLLVCLCYAAWQCCTLYVGAVL